MTILTKNDWLTTNIDSRRQGFKTDFKVFVKPYHYKQIKSFKEESINTAEELCTLNQKLFVGLSGGYDSEFVCKVFQDATVPFVPIIVSFDGNQKELQYAYKFCERSKLDPVIINLSDYDLASIICKEIIIGLNGTGIFSVGSLVSEKYAKSQQGILVTGDHMIGDDEIINNFTFYVPEHDFYANAVGFFTYRIEQVKSMLGLVSLYSDWLDYKHNVYQIEYRQKNRPKYNKEVQHVINVTFKSKYTPVINKHLFGSKEQLIGLL